MSHVKIKISSGIYEIILTQNKSSTRRGITILE